MHSSVCHSRATRQQYDIFTETVSLEFHEVVLFLTVVFNIEIWLCLHTKSKSTLQEGTTRPTAPRFFVTANVANAFLKRSNVTLIIFIVFVAFIEFCTYEGNSRVSYSIKFISCECDRLVCKDLVGGLLVQKFSASFQQL